MSYFRECISRVVSSIARLYAGSRLTRSVRLDGCRKDRTIALEVGTAAITDPASNTVFSEMVAFEEPTLVLSVL